MGHILMIQEPYICFF